MAGARRQVLLSLRRAMHHENVIVPNAFAFVGRYSASRKRKEHGMVQRDKTGNDRSETSNKRVGKTEQDAGLPRAKTHSVDLAPSQPVLQSITKSDLQQIHTMRQYIPPLPQISVVVNNAPGEHHTMRLHTAYLGGNSVKKL